MKDCLNCKHSIERAPGIEDARCYCSRMEIHIFNNQPFYCSDYEGEKNTNGDRIRQMSNEELAEFFALAFMCDGCPLKDVECIGDGETARTYAHCYDKLIAWLNAHEACVAENGESAKQADLCCKSAKESERME